MAGFTAFEATIKVGSDAVEKIEEFTVNNAGNIAAWSDNSTGGGTTRAKGAEDSTGTMKYVVSKTSTIPWKFGDTATVIFHVDGDDTGTYTIPIIITSEPVNCALAGADNVSVIYEWGATGVVVRAGILSASGV